MDPGVVVFDIGGVLVDWNAAYFYRKRLPEEAKVDHFLSSVCSPEWNQQFDGGMPFSDGVDAVSAVQKGKEARRSTAIGNVSADQFEMVCTGTAAEQPS
jgi:hypothetical protein